MTAIAAILREELVPLEAVIIVGSVVGFMGGWALISIRHGLGARSYTGALALITVAALSLGWAFGGNREDVTILPRMVTSLAVLVELYGQPKSMARWLGLSMAGAVVCILALFVGPLSLWTSLILLAGIATVRWRRRSTAHRTRP